MTTVRESGCAMGPWELWWVISCRRTVERWRDCGMKRRREAGWKECRMITKVWSAGRTGAVRAGERLLVRLQVSDYAEVIGPGEDFTNLELGASQFNHNRKGPHRLFYK